LARLLEITKFEDVKYNSEGLQALIFTAEGDMRQAINNLQSTVAGFGFVNDVNVFKIVDQPHPLVVQKILTCCIKGNIDDALDLLDGLWKKGYSAIDIVTSSFKVAKTLPGIGEQKRLDLIKEIGFVHMRVLEGVGSYLQLCGMLAKICS
jgi:ATPase involved in DNA replication